ncbi:Arc family DNA-binding protein [Pseudomonas aeruginosa]|uniref:Arc family DNA-binding protein n=1 Tax=Pseudomonas aeruginosa TaxID=287 RepID=UPI002076A85F|nr:Arc family DNA-binding protein [Pseudomonas aeruginosa]MCM8576990.1 Arc family DNA-binding protein [Pseudomonas aeruginosa]MDQ4223305.1 Arc family DNA-binding protein [Pseudomonas aeruginosa]HBN8519056.1 Arc family DNA-binding protein [Pseudomonas aeruginosa]HBP6285820.1 Arc family DNA-binding protein [Pseudomonas aeruginosa]HDQ9754288.1 Arc family DNA-binding protein [Pseudomonas aeruginosa]
MSRTDPQFNLRIPSALKDALAEAARIRKRSVTAEIIERLEASFTASDLEPLRVADAVQCLLDLCAQKQIKVQISLGEIEPIRD